MIALGSDLAERSARVVAHSAGRGNGRRAALRASVASGTTRSVAAARAALEASHLPDVRAAAITLLRELDAARGGHLTGPGL